MSAITDFGMDTITLNGSLEAKLAAIKAAGFSQVMLGAQDIASHPQGASAAIDAVLASGLRATGFQVLRDFEGLSGHLHDYKLDIAKAMLQMCHALGSKVLLACSSTSQHASADPDVAANDLRKLATLALPLDIRIAYEGLSWGRTINEYTTAWDVVERANWPNLGVGIDSYHIIAAETDPEPLDQIDPSRIFLVQLSDFMWQEVSSFEDRKNTARAFRVFPGEGVHSEQLAALVRRLDRNGFRGDYSFEVFNEDYRQLPAQIVCERARRSAYWVSQNVLKRGLPLPGWASS